MQTAIQLYTVRHIDEPFLDIIDRVGETSFAGVEFATRVGEADPADVRDRLAATDLAAVGAHVGVDALEDDFDAAVETAHALGYEDVVVPWLDPEHWESVEAVEATADRLSTLAAALADEGLTLHYHNHDHEFVETDEGYALDVLAERAPSVRLEVDAGWVTAAGADPVSFMERHADRIDLVHMKDAYAGTSALDDLDQDRIPELGEGDLDVDAVAATAADIGAEWLVYENDEPVDPVAALDHGAEVLSRYV